MGRAGCWPAGQVAGRVVYTCRAFRDRLAARVVTVVRFLPPGGAVRPYEFVGDPGEVPLDPRWHQAA